MQPDEVLDKAADALERRGWTRHDYVDDDGRLCAVGALLYATEHLPRLTSEKSLGRNAVIGVAAAAILNETAHPAWQRATRISRTFASRGHLIGWNDITAEDQDQVVTAMRHAAKRLRSGA